MDAMSWPDKQMKKLIDSLSINHPGLKFKAGSAFCWSPVEGKIIYKDKADDIGAWSLLHEVAHALLEHQTYQSDLELLMMEVSAWHKAQKLAPDYGFYIDENHVQDCLDTYRDWLDQRSTCPLCGNTGLQHSAREYSCFNCSTKWQVSASRFCRPYRQLKRGGNQQSRTDVRNVLEFR